MMRREDTLHAWWSRLRHQGLLLSPVVMVDRFPAMPSDLSWQKNQTLRDAYTRFRAQTAPADANGKARLEERSILEWVDALFGPCLGHQNGRFAKSNDIPENLRAMVRIGNRTESLRPHRVLFPDDAKSRAALLIAADTSAQVGRGRGRNTYARFLELLRGTGSRLGLLTNGSQFRLVYAGLDFESWSEWEAERWFEDEDGADELAGLRLLLAPDSVKPGDSGSPFLLEAVEESRKRQADLSIVLRENVRQAIEFLMEEVSAENRANADLLEPVRVGAHAPLSDREVLDALYQAGVRVVMRLAVCLFAESRGLLPVNDPVFAQSYSVRSLYELLEEGVRDDGGAHNLFNAHSAWPRLTALFRLIHSGSPHGGLTLRAYGGTLFRPGREDDSDPVLRALYVLEQRLPVTDATVRDVLRKLLRGPLPVVRGRQKTFVEGPVDYTQLRTEFIGLIYQGLLDYRLKRADEGEGPQVFLNIGREPVLPLVRLETMLHQDPKGLKDLLTKLRKEQVTATVSSEEEEEAEEEQTEEVAAEVTAEPVVEETQEESPVSEDHRDAWQRALDWARQAVVLAGLVPKQRKNETDREHEKRTDEEARRLIKHVVAKGEFYLVRAGNTRKGTGTFYTRPQLAVPTVHRTLEPLCYEKSGTVPSEGGTTETGLSPISVLVPKTPETILALKVCDPACGSGSFNVAALHYLTDALYVALCHHCGLDDPKRAKTITLPYGRPRTGAADEEIVPFPPDDPQRGDQFEDRVKALLRRHVVERCIYGVDVNPLAVEFARVSLWIETLDQDLPFTFLDHKIKVGNSLVGCWLDRVLDYPIRAWEREGGDGKDGDRTQRIEEFLKGPKVGNRRSGDGVIKQEMRSLIEQRFRGQMPLFKDDAVDIAHVVEQARADCEQLHQMALHDPEAREQFYREHIQNSPAVQRLKRAMDEWCAVWFWPMDEDSAKCAPTPRVFHAVKPTQEAVLQRLSSEQRFFHWEIEFPDVFAVGRFGFDATLGNPPWEVMKPNSHEFFSEYDPVYRTYDKQAALRRQQELFAMDPAIRAQWDEYCAGFKALSNWVQNVAEPFGVSLARGGTGQALAELWTEHRKKRKAPHFVHPFAYQGSADLNSYKLFLELSYSLLAANGRMGLIVPSGVYTDSGSGDLRVLFLEHSTWDWLFSFENRKKIFDIHGSFKFAPVIIDRQRTDAPLRAAFMVHDLDAWDRPDPPVFTLDRDLIPLFSPRSKSIPEVRTGRDLEICRKIYEHSIRIGDRAPGWEIQYATEFHMTNDSKLFKPREWWETKGYRPDPFGRWIGPGGDVALPLYEGRMIGQFDFSQKGWVSGKGRTAVWRSLPFDAKTIEPQFLMSESVFAEHSEGGRSSKLGFMDITSATNARTMISTALVHAPCGNKVPTITLQSCDEAGHLFLSTLANSLSFDFAARTRLGGITLNWFIAEELPLAISDESPRIVRSLAICAARLTFIHRRFAPEWLRLHHLYRELRAWEWKRWWAVTEADRLRLRVEIDALCADLYGLDPDDFDWIVRDDPTDPKGFWRVDKQLPYEQRLTGLASRAFRALKEGQWSAETVGDLTNDQFFELLGIPELTSEFAAKKKGYDRPLIYNRDGCHRWQPELFPKDDPRHGYTWQDCHNDAVALLGSEEAVRQYLDGDGHRQEEKGGAVRDRTDSGSQQEHLF